MERVDFLMKNGRVRVMALRQAEALSKLKLGTYQTRDVGHMATVTKPMVAATGDGLDAMTREELFALAEARGIKVHGASGADKVRAALRA